MGKTTLIKILMGFLRPSAGRCRVFGEEAHNLSPATRERIGFLFEGHLAYEFKSIEQVERFYAPHYSNCNRNCYYDLVDRLGLPLKNPEPPPSSHPIPTCPSTRLLRCSANGEYARYSPLEEPSIRTEHLRNIGEFLFSAPQTAAPF